MSLLRDETGTLSSARVGFFSVLPFVFLVIILDLRAGVTVPTDAYALLGGLLTALIAWAGGPRVGKYLAGGVSGALSRIGTGGDAQRGRFPGMRLEIGGDDPANDDER